MSEHHRMFWIYGLGAPVASVLLAVGLLMGTLVPGVVAWAILVLVPGFVVPLLKELYTEAVANLAVDDRTDIDERLERIEHVANETMFQMIEAAQVEYDNDDFIVTV